MTYLRALLLSVLATSALAACGDDGGDGDGTPTPDADLTAPDADPNAVLGFLEECNVENDQCDSSMDHICFTFNNKGPHCSHECETADDCEAPSSGCNGMGFCKLP